ncbi:hypothetical protein NMY22_g14620 [Coprinellus aureogranulatus]|nr:hypothetical protein NMY22_g14620 [Coprinellus aureogranulatus]
MSRAKNCVPAAVQISAEQLLYEAQEAQDPILRVPTRRIENLEELDEYQSRKRTEYEERVRQSKSKWMRYANWEASQNDLARSRSVFERALDVDPASIQTWLSYVEMELKNRNVQHARNLLDRAVAILPRVDQLWYKYVYLEELLGSASGARQVFERWMKWEPEAKAWQAYIKLEGRYGELDRASLLYERLIALKPEPKSWVKWAEFEERRGNVEKAREVFKMALDFFGEGPEGVERAQPIYLAFAEMEARLKEFERARVTYKSALDNLPLEKGATLHDSYTMFEKRYGTKGELGGSVLAKRQFQYEEELKRDSRDYDAWLEYARMEEEAWNSLHSGGASSAEERESQGERVQEIYKRAIGRVPLENEKQHWRRYIFLWLRYAIFEETQRKDLTRAREVYKAAINIVPHKSFTFSKLWLMFAKFEVRQLDLPAARKILGTAIGMCPKPSLFKRYIELEIELREFDRARTLYEKYLEFDPSNSTAWVSYAELEAQLADLARARGIYELGLTQNLHMPEILWKSYIDFEAGQGNRDGVWESYALFEGQDLVVEQESDEKEDEKKVLHGNPALARAVFRRGHDALKEKGLKQERLALLEAWQTFEDTNGTAEDSEAVKRLMPINHVGDIIFPDERETGPAKFIQMAQAWKESQEQNKTSMDAD